MLRENIFPVLLQVVITFFLVFFSFYMYALIEIEPFDEDYIDDELYNTEEDENVRKNNKTVNTINNDGDLKL